jgi:UDPglucose 6-dehydrogenase
VSAVIEGDLAGKTIGILGLTFKPNTDDMRDAPSIDLIQALQAQGARIRAYDPEGMTEARHIFSDVEFADDPYGVVENADALVIVTEWDQFRALDFNRMRLLMRRPALVDLRNIYDPQTLRSLGFQYSSIGRPATQDAV